MDARSCSLTPSKAEVHEARPHPGQMLVAQLTTILLDSAILHGNHGSCERVKDPYSFRCAPQVHGAVHESFVRLDETEPNSTVQPIIRSFSLIPQIPVHEVVSQGIFMGKSLP